MGIQAIKTMGLPPKVAFPRFCDDFREKTESLQIDICLSIGDLQTFGFFRKARERWGNGLFQQPHYGFKKFTGN